jgi:hypothetical protein
MIGAGMLVENLHDLYNATQEAYDWGDYVINYSNEGKRLSGAFGNWTQTKEAKDFVSVVEYFPESPEGKPIFDHLGQTGHIVDTKTSFGTTNDPDSHYTYLDNEDLAQVGDHVDQAGHNVQALEGTN